MVFILTAMGSLDGVSYALEYIIAYDSGDCFSGTSNEEELPCP